MPIDSDSCGEVAAYLDRFGDSRSRPEVDRISEHVKCCPACYSKMSEFFRVMEVPDTEYLDETLNDLTLAIYNLVKSLMAKTRAEAADSEEESESTHDNVRFVVEPGDTSEYVQEGQEMIEDVQDFTGSDEVRGASMEGIRNLVERSPDEFDLAISLLEKSADLDGESSLDCLNLKGILYMERNIVDSAEAAFAAVINSKRGDLYTRKVQVHAMNNLSYACAAQDRFDEAIKWATRSKVLAEETDLDPLGARFGLVYFYLSRAADGDQALAAAEIEALTRDNASTAEFLRCLDLKTNEAIRSLVEQAGLRPEAPK